MCNEQDLFGSYFTILLLVGQEFLRFGQKGLDFRVSGNLLVLVGFHLVCSVGSIHGLLRGFATLI